MITSDGWSSRCESGNCVETRTRNVEGCEYVEVRDTETDGTLLVTAKAWEAHEAGIRAEGFREAVKALRSAEEETNYWNDFEDAADYIEAYLEVLTAVRDDTKGTADDD